MAPSPAPATPETPRRVAMNRSFTVPTNIASAGKPTTPNAETGSKDAVETLFTHPNANIVKFITSSRPDTGWSSPGRDQTSLGTLPWAIPTERTIAAGPMEIYRVPGSVSFLRSGELLQPIMRRSQCWCVDGVSKFVLRVLTDTYYRIELPGETEEDLEEVEKMKITLQKVLFYEKTACPFKRTFAMDLPEMPEVRKGRRKSAGPAKKWKLDRVWRPEGWVETEGRGSEDSGSGSSAGSEDESGSQDNGSSGEKTPVETEAPSEVRKPNLGLSTRARALAALRSVSAPQHPTLQKTSPSRLRARVDLDGTVKARGTEETGSRSQERPRLRVFQAIPTDMPPSPPDSSAGLDYVENQPQSEGGAADERISDGEQWVDEQSTVRQSVGVPGEAYAEVYTHPIEETQDQSAPDDGPSIEQTHTLIEEQNEDPVEPSSQDSVEEPLEDSSTFATSEQEQREDSEIVRPTTPTNPTSIDDLSQQEESREHRPSTPKDQTSPEDLSQQEEDEDHRPTTPQDQTNIEDPYDAIQARILARRSIGGTTAFLPSNKSPTRQSTSSTATISSAISRGSRSSQRQEAFASAMVKKACTVFLGPPAHLVALMLRIAARFANGAFGVDSMFYVESPANLPGQVPATYRLQGNVVDEPAEVASDSDEDDFGVPLRSPVRLAGRRESAESVQERRGWVVE